MLKNRIAVTFLMLAISSSLVACKSDTTEKENIEQTQINSVDIQGDVLDTGGNFNKLLVSNSTNTANENNSESPELKNEEEIKTADDSENSRPPIGLAVKDSKDRVDIEEDKVIGTIEYDTMDISEFNDCSATAEIDAVNGFTTSTQLVLSKFLSNSEIVAGYLSDICIKYHIDVSTVESDRGLKVDESLNYKIIVAHNDKYNIYLAINKEDYTAKYSVKEK